MPKEGEGILKYNHGEKSLKAQFVIDLDIECILQKEHSCQNNSEKSCINRKAKNKSCSCWTMFIKYSFDATKDKLDYYRGIDFIKELFKKLKDHATEIINYKEKVMMLRTDQETKTVCQIRNKSFVSIKMRKISLSYIIKLKIIAETPENLEELLTVFVI